MDEIGDDLAVVSGHAYFVLENSAFSRLSSRQVLALCDFDFSPVADQELAVFPVAPWGVVVCTDRCWFCCWPLLAFVGCCSEILVDQQDVETSAAPQDDEVFVVFVGPLDVAASFVADVAVSDQVVLGLEVHVLDLEVNFIIL